MKRMIAAMTIIPRPRNQFPKLEKKKTVLQYKVFRLNESRPEVLITACQFAAYLFIMGTNKPARNISVTL